MKIDGGMKDIGSRKLDEVDLVQFVDLEDTIGEEGSVADKGDTSVDAEDVDRTGAGETRSVLENTFGTETETGMENLEEDGADVGLDEAAGLDNAVDADLAEDELGVAETGLGLIDGFEVEPVFGRCAVSDGQLWSFGKRCWGQNSLWHLSHPMGANSTLPHFPLAHILLPPFPCCLPLAFITSQKRLMCLSMRTFGSSPGGIATGTLHRGQFGATRSM